MVWVLDGSSMGLVSYPTQVLVHVRQSYSALQPWMLKRIAHNILCCCFLFVQSPLTHGALVGFLLPVLADLCDALAAAQAPVDRVRRLL